jgi:lysophospholipase L1-like esterase
VDEGGLRPSLAGVLVAVLAGLLLFALIGEAGLRVLGYSGMYSPAWEFFSPDPVLGWTNAPDAEGEFKGPIPWPTEYDTRVKINSMGLRGREPSSDDVDAVRVLAIGDSLTAGFEVTLQQTFASKLEEKLATLLDARTRVFNGGVRGYGTDQTYLRYRENLRQLSPHLVLLTFTWNDVDDNVTIHRMGRPFAKSAFALRAGGGLELIGSPVPHYPQCSSYRLDERYEIVSNTKSSARALCRIRDAVIDHSAFLTFVTIMGTELPGFITRTVAAKGPGEADPPGPKDHAVRLTNHLLWKLADAVHDDGADFVVAGRSEDLSPLDLRSLEKRGVEVIDLDGVYEGDPQAVRFRHDPHWNARGHERAAEILAPRLAERLRARGRGAP